MAETTGHMPEQSMSGPVARNSSGALTVVALAVAPQIIDFLGTLAGVIFRFGSRDPI